MCGSKQKYFLELDMQFHNCFVQNSANSDTCFYDVTRKEGLDFNVVYLSAYFKITTQIWRSSK